MNDEDDGEQIGIEATPEFDAGDPAAVGARKKDIEIRQRESDRFWAAVFGSAVGRREMWGVLTAGKPFETPFAVGPNGFPQPEATWFKAGQAELSLRMYRSWLAKYPLEMQKMHLENDPNLMPAPKQRRKRSDD